MQQIIHMWNYRYILDCFVCFVFWGGCKSGAGEGIRTPDRLVRSQVLYPAELHPHR